ncbi:MAG TPA: hypothetical protein VLQ93_13755 [Myxococcaceae bacterium]|nr:hypothetical protein [Myxococcaceae bacterium]
MGKVLTVVLGLAVVLGAVWYALNGAGRASSEGEASAPRRQLDNVRESAARIESDAEQRARELEAKMKAAE